MIDNLFKQLMDEKHGFHEYMELYEEATDSSIKAKIHSIATQEAQHYKELYEMIFNSDPNKTWTPIEKAMCHQAKEWYEDMLEELK